MRITTVKVIPFMLCSILVSCTEPYELSSKNSKSLLVVESTITDELKRQEVKLSKTFRLDSNEPIAVNDAEVSIVLGNGVQYNFTQTQPGLYSSIQEFKAIDGENYTMNILLSDGSSYASTTEVLPPTSDIESVEPIVLNVNGQDGIQIFVNSISESDAVYFKYEYEETYKIVVPYYNILDLELINVNLDNGLYYELELVEKDQDVSVCYSTVESTDIIQTSLADSQGDSVIQFPVRFIDSDNGIIRDRYSILVKQYVQSLEAYNYYNIMKELGTVDNIFSNNQPGFLQGNIKSLDNIEENVLGFFQVASVTSKRIYFNYSDLNIQKPPYIYECFIATEVDYTDNTGIDGDRNDYQFLYNVLNWGSYNYLSGQFPTYSLVSTQCADCTSFSSTLIPEFWEE